MRKTQSAITLFILLAVGLGFTSCKDDEISNDGSVQLDIRLTDSPGEYEEVNVDVQSVEIHSDESGWQELSEINPGIYNLLDFTNGKDTLIASAKLPEGKISQIRLILGENNTLKIGDDIVPLNTPSAQQSGLKIKINTELKAGIAYTIVLDFDAGRSVVKAGNSGKYNLKPVIRAITEISSGAIKGVVSPAQSAYVMAANEQDTVGSYSDDEGLFILKGVPQGTYGLTVTADTTMYEVFVKENIAVGLGEIVDVDTLKLTEK